MVAAALTDRDGLWLMHRRPEGKHHAGLWEFPGGKVEAAETREHALVREIHEELGITMSVADLEPAGFAQEPASIGRPQIVILLYTCPRWEGEPHALEGGSIGWFTPLEIAALAKPPLDQRLAAQLFRDFSP